MFVLKNTPDIPELRLGDITFSGKGNEHTTALFDITFLLLKQLMDCNVHLSILLNCIIVLPLKV
jgi:hypothetical protein